MLRNTINKLLRNTPERKKKQEEKRNKNIEKGIETSSLEYQIRDLAKKYSGYNPNTLIKISNAYYSGNDLDRAIEYANRALSVSNDLELIKNINCKFNRTSLHKESIIDELVTRYVDSPDDLVTITFNAFLSDIRSTKSYDIALSWLTDIHSYWPNNLSCLYNLANLTLKRAKVVNTLFGIHVLEEEGSFVKGNDRFIRKAIELYKELFNKTYNANLIPDELKPFVINDYNFSNRTENSQTSWNILPKIKTLEYYLDVLGIDSKTSYSDAHRKYKKLFFQYHPDRNLGNKEAEERAKEISEAWQEVKDLLK